MNWGPQFGSQYYILIHKIVWQNILSSLAATIVSLVVAFHHLYRLSLVYVRDIRLQNAFRLVPIKTPPQFSRHLLPKSNQYPKMTFPNTNTHIRTLLQNQPQQKSIGRRPQSSNVTLQEASPIIPPHRPLKFRIEHRAFTEHLPLISIIACARPGAIFRVVHHHG